MKIAAVSDIHSNIYALEAVIADMKKRGYDICVNLGDILYGPIAPRATYDCLMSESFLTIRGNQDRQIYDATAEDYVSNPTMAFIIEDLGDEPLAWMRELPETLLPTGDVFLCHGTPSNDLVYLLEDVTQGVPTVRPDADILNLLEGQPESLIVCGHTHIPRSVMLSTKQLVVNPGSVGLPAYTDSEPVHHTMATFNPHASYAMIEKTNKGWSVQHIDVPYEYGKAATMAKANARMDWVHYLTTGRGKY